MPTCYTEKDDRPKQAQKVCYILNCTKILTINKYRIVNGKKKALHTGGSYGTCILLICSKLSFPSIQKCTLKCHLIAILLS